MTRGMELPSRPIVVAIATYRRPNRLSGLLESLKTQASELEALIVVVDNDPGESARAVVAGASFEIEYLVQPAPGISEARNAAIEFAKPLNPWAVAFIDDDELADENWLAELLKTMVEFDADVSTGRVRYRLPDSADAIVREANCFRELQREEGCAVTYVATNNTLVRATWLYDTPSLRFDNSYSLTGGSDLEFFLRLQHLGGKCVWSAAALVLSDVTDDRSSRAWLAKRELRNGQLMSRLRRQFDGYSRPRIATIGLGKVFEGLALAFQNIDGSPIRRHASALKVMAGVGWLRVSVGILYLEYARRPPRSGRPVNVIKNKTMSAQDA